MVIAVVAKVDISWLFYPASPTSHPVPNMSLPFPLESCLLPHRTLSLTNLQCPPYYPDLINDCTYFPGCSDWSKNGQENNKAKVLPWY